MVEECLITVQPGPSWNIPKTCHCVWFKKVVLLKSHLVLTRGVDLLPRLSGAFWLRGNCLVPVFRWLSGSETERRSKPFWSTCSHQGVHPHNCSRLAHIWCPNETNDLRRATVELCLQPRQTWNVRICETTFIHPHWLFVPSCVTGIRKKVAF